MMEWIFWVLIFVCGAGGYFFGWIEGRRDMSDGVMSFDLDKVAFTPAKDLDYTVHINGVVEDVRVVSDMLTNKEYQGKMVLQVPKEK